MDLSSSNGGNNNVLQPSPLINHVTTTPSAIATTPSRSPPPQLTSGIISGNPDSNDVKVVHDGDDERPDGDDQDG